VQIAAPSMRPGDVVSITCYQPNGVFTSERIED